VSSGRDRIDWAAALAFYVALDPPRSFARVARKFGVSDTAVRKHAHRENWRAKADAIEAKAEAKALESGLRSREQRIAAVLKTIDVGLDQVGGDLDKGAQRLGTDRFAEWVKLAELLSGEATDRVSVAELQEAMRMIVSLADRTLVEVVEATLPVGKRTAVLQGFRLRYVPALNEALGVET
jgi:transposase-like protein